MCAWPLTRLLTGVFSGAVFVSRRCRVFLEGQLPLLTAAISGAEVASSYLPRQAPYFQIR